VSFLIFFYMFWDWSLCSFVSFIMFNSYCVGNQDEFFIEDFDVGPMDTIDLYDMTFREDPSDFDDNLLYAMRDRTKQLRSFKVLFHDVSVIKLNTVLPVSLFLICFFFIIIIREK